jgi:SAM-dependent methyltransferase
VGCGSGVLLAYLAQKGFRNAEGVDISEEQIEIARARNLRIQCGDVFAFLESKVEAYKAVIAIDFIEHFTKEEALNLLPLFFRSLKKDGILLLQTPNGQGLFAAQIIYGDLTHCTIFTPESLRQVLRLAGFDHILFDETGPVQKDLKGTLRLVLWKIIKAGANFARLVEAGKQQNIWTENLICVSRRPSTSNGG